MNVSTGCVIKQRARLFPFAIHVHLGVVSILLTVLHAIFRGLRPYNDRGP